MNDMDKLIIHLKSKVQLWREFAEENMIESQKYEGDKLGSWYKGHANSFEICADTLEKLVKQFAKEA